MRASHLPNIRSSATPEIKAHRKYGWTRQSQRVEKEEANPLAGGLPASRVRRKEERLIGAHACRNEREREGCERAARNSWASRYTAPWSVSQCPPFCLPGSSVTHHSVHVLGKGRSHMRTVTRDALLTSATSAKAREFADQFIRRRAQSVPSPRRTAHANRGWFSPRVTFSCRIMTEHQVVPISSTLVDLAASDSNRSPMFALSKIVTREDTLRPLVHRGRQWSRGSSERLGDRCFHDFLGHPVPSSGRASWDRSRLITVRIYESRKDARDRRAIADLREKREEPLTTTTTTKENFIADGDSERRAANDVSVCFKRGFSNHKVKKYK